MSLNIKHGLYSIYDIIKTIKKNYNRCVKKAKYVCIEFIDK